MRIYDRYGRLVNLDALNVHGATHQTGGVDEFSIAGLSGEPAALASHKNLATGVHGAGAHYLAIAAGSQYIALNRLWSADRILKGGGSSPPSEISSWEKIAEVNLSSTVTAVDFTDLDLSRDKFYILFAAIYNPQAAVAAYLLFFNGDSTGTNYWRQRMFVSGTSVSADRANNPGVLGVAANEHLVGMLVIGRSGGKVAVVQQPQTGATGSIIEMVFRVMNWETSANVTSMSFVGTPVNTIGAGSILLLCKPRTA